jgi:transcriptional regulator with XRE-family HTH domain
MDLKQLIDAASLRAGGKAKLARDMDKRPPRISEWYNGTHKPDAHELAYMAERAGLPVLETVAEIEAQLDPRYSQVWRDALGKLKAAGVTAAVVGAMISPEKPALAFTLHSVKAAICILC